VTAPYITTVNTQGSPHWAILSALRLLREWQISHLVTCHTVQTMCLNARILLIFANVITTWCSYSKKITYEI
jgi:hypothetical protein